MSIKRAAWLVAIVLWAGASNAQAPQQQLSLGGSRTDYSNDAGSRDAQFAEYHVKNARNAGVVSLVTGQREYANGRRFTGRGIFGTYYRRWSDEISTRSHAAFSSNDPVFATRVLDQDVTYAGLKSVALTVGARQVRYFEDVDATSWYVAGTYYFSRVMMRYRYGRHDTDGLGPSAGHLLTVRVRDSTGQGSTQLWLSHGTSLHDYAWAPEVLPGRQRGVSIRRVQPLNAGLSVNVALEHRRYEIPTLGFDGWGGTLGMNYAW